MNQRKPDLACGHQHTRTQREGVVSLVNTNQPPSPCHRHTAIFHCLLLPIIIFAVTITVVSRKRQCIINLWLVPAIMMVPIKPLPDLVPANIVEGLRGRGKEKGMEGVG